LKMVHGATLLDIFSTGLSLDKVSLLPGGEKAQSEYGDA
jgi:hypothetical protein